VRLADGWSALDHFALRVGLTALRCRRCYARFYRFVTLPDPVLRKLSGGNVFQLALRVLAGRRLPGARKQMPMLPPPAQKVRYVVRAMPGPPAELIQEQAEEAKHRKEVANSKDAAMSKEAAMSAEEAQPRAPLPPSQPLPAKQTASWTPRPFTLRQPPSQRPPLQAQPPLQEQPPSQQQPPLHEQPASRPEPRPFVTILSPEYVSPLRQAASSAGNRRLLGDGNRRAPGTSSNQLFCVLLLDDDPSVRRLFNRLLSREGYIVQEASDIAAANAELRSMRTDVLVVNLSKSHDEALAVRAFRKIYPNLTLVVLSENAPASFRKSERVLYLSRPCRVSHLISLIADVAAQAPPSKPVVLAAAYTA
jgi:CheY-like chemotaxis protein